VKKSTPPRINLQPPTLATNEARALCVRARLGSTAALLSAALLPLAAGAAPAGPADATGAKQESFPIVEFRVLGNHVLEPLKVEAAVYPFLGPNRSLETVRKAQEALTAVYHDAGFGTVLVDIPEQSVDDGVVRLKVTEGRIERVRIEGAKYYSQRRILEALPALTPGAVPRLPQLQSELGQLAAESRDREITPILKAGSAPGLVDVDLKVKDQLPLHGSVAVDDRYSADTAHVRLTGNLSYNNLFQRNEVLSLTYQLAPSAPSEVKLWVLSYLGHLPAPDWDWNVYAIRSDSNVAAVGTLSVIGNGKIYAAHLVHAFDSSSSSVSSLNLGADYKNFPQNVLLPGDVSAATPIHYVLWSAQAATTRTHEGYDVSGNLGVYFGLPGIGGNDAEFEFKRSQATPSFAYLRGSGSLTWRFGHGFAIVGRTQFQYTDAPLVSNEQMTLGGEDTVRGYLEAEELVDSGIAAGLELHSPKLILGTTQTFGYLFYDRGVGMIQQPLPSEIESGLVRTELASFGLGLQLTAFKQLSANLAFADPVLTGSRTQRGDGRALFSFLYSF
jgi:hemolysin activation/secretion protein